MTKPPYTRSWKDRHGVIRWGFRKGARTVPLPGQPGDREFAEAYQAAIEGRDRVIKARPVRHAENPRSLARVWDLVVKTPAFRAMRPHVQAKQTQTARRVFTLKVPDSDLRIGDLVIDEMRRPHVHALLGLFADRPQAGGEMLRILRKLISVALDHEWVEYDVTHKLKWRPKSTPIHGWTQAERQAFERRWPIGTNARLAYALALYTGARRSDLHRIRWEDLAGDELHIVTKKTGRSLYLPIMDELREVLAKADPKTDTILTNGYGVPFTANGLGMRMQGWTKAAGLKGCSLHGLRKAMGAALAEKGATTKEIMEVLGHTDMAQAELYVRDASQRTLARTGLRRLAGGKLTAIKGGKD